VPYEEQNNQIEYSFAVRWWKILWANWKANWHFKAHHHSRYVLLN
jgi:hypothetical protein